MKRNIYLLALSTLLALTGCGGKEIENRDARALALAALLADDVGALDSLDMLDGLIRHRIAENWKPPKDARNGLAAELTVEFSASGEVFNTWVSRSSGDDSYDESALRAVRKAGSFPVIAEFAKTSSGELDQPYLVRTLLFAH